MTRWARQFLLGIAALTFGIGIWCQVVQRTDPQPAATYFTVWSAALAVVVLVAGLIDPGRVPVDLWGPATVGTVLSGVVFAAVIAPASETGTWFQPHDDRWVRAATVLLHGVGPVLMLIAFILVAPPSPRPWSAAARWCSWPGLYLAVILSMQALDVTEVPYPFLDPEETAWPLLTAAIVILGLVFLIIGRLILCSDGRRRQLLRGPGATPSVD